MPHGFFTFRVCDYYMAAGAYLHCVIISHTHDRKLNRRTQCSFSHMPDVRLAAQHQAIR